ncbi:MAG: carbamoyltransferase HypF [Chloroflexota bacterium]
MEETLDSRLRARLLIRGAVQGVGFRPFIHRLASEHALKGWVLNSTEGVACEVEGPQEQVQRFLQDLRPKAPPLAVIEHLEASFLPPVGYTSFDIQPSREALSQFVLISPDIAVCPDCLREMQDPGDRRHDYPFTNCTNCGPRFTIVENIPYDRPKTTMKAFAMCQDCQREYHDPGDRRFHAQPIACPACGPRVWLIPGNEGRAASGTFTSKEILATGPAAIDAARELLRQGAIVTIKGLGGFHLACDATNPVAVQELRERKQRVDKPFAIMSPDARAVASYCHLAPGEQQLLESPQRPIVLLRRQEGAPIAPAVAPNNCYLGVMLPYTPLHHLLFSQEGDRPAGRWPLALVMTSGNRSEEPIAKDNGAALEQLAPLADYFLLHDRDIHVRCDDSVTRLFQGKEAVIRRSRGYAPFPVRLDFPLQEILACGGELKNTFCLTRDNYAFLSQHIGDLENLETLESFESNIEHFKRLFRIEPKIVAHDLHPDYLSTKYAQELASNHWAQSTGSEVRLIPVQHHHAHMASVMAENGLNETVIGVSFDGTGYGIDGAIWGGEFLVGDYRGFHRAAHLKYVPLPGGTAAIKRPYRMALSHLFNALRPDAFSIHLPLWEQLEPSEQAVLRRQIETGLGSPPTSSMGRLFDAVSSLLGIRQVINYEGQAAIELEMVAQEGVEGSYEFAIQESGVKGHGLLIDPAPLFRDLIADIKAGVPTGVISARFHRGIAEMIATVCGIIRKRHGLNKVVLSGGVFQNVYLLLQALRCLERLSFEAYIHHLVPANDGGISLGQALVANAVAEV